MKGAKYYKLMGTPARPTGVTIYYKVENGNLYVFRPPDGSWMLSGFNDPPNHNAAKNVKIWASKCLKRITKEEMFFELL